MAKFIREEYHTDKNVKQQQFAGVLETFWGYDGPLLTSRTRGSVLQDLRVAVQLPHPNGSGGFYWLRTQLYVSDTDEADLRVRFTASEPRESKLPNAQEIWSRVGFCLKSNSPVQDITKILDAEERLLAQDNLAASIAKQVGQTLDSMTAEAENAAKVACDYNRRLVLLDAEYEHQFRTALVEAVNNLCIDDVSPPETSLVVQWVRENMHHIKRKPRGGFRGTPTYQSDYGDVFKWLTKNPGKGWGKLLDAFAGRDKRP